MRGATVSNGIVTNFTPAETKRYVYLGGSGIRELDNTSPPNALKEYVRCGSNLVAWASCQCQCVTTLLTGETPVPREVGVPVTAGVEPVNLPLTRSLTQYVRGLDLGGGIGGIIYQKKGMDYYYYHYNHKGDVVALTDGTGKLAAYYEYDAWGNTMTQARKSGVDNPYRYSTKEWDEKSGLSYFGARYYSPEIGRWTQRDPLGEVDGLNLYAYCKADPAGRLDPLGLQFMPPIIFTPSEDLAFPDARYRPAPGPEREASKRWCLARFETCLGNCIDANRLDLNEFLDWWGIIQVGGNLVFGEKATHLGRGQPLTNWQHKLFWWIGRRMGWGEGFIRVGRVIGKWGVAATVLEGWFKLGVELYCAGVCAIDPDAF